MGVSFCVCISDEMKIPAKKNNKRIIYLCYFHDVYMLIRKYVHTIVYNLIWMAAKYL